MSSSLASLTLGFEPRVIVTLALERGLMRFQISEVPVSKSTREAYQRDYQKRLQERRKQERRMNPKVIGRPRTHTEIPAGTNKESHAEYVRLWRAVRAIKQTEK